jgi:hypothetical protein
MQKPIAHDLSIAAQIEQVLGSVNVPQLRPFAATHDKFHAVFLKKRRLTGGYVVSKGINRLLF